MKIFTVSGLGADSRVFNYLELNAELVHIEWIEPLNKEKIDAYAKRLIVKYNLEKEEELIILGVSFGGLVAVEMSKQLKPKLTIVIASALTNSELPFVLKLVRETKIIDWIPLFLLDPPRSLAHYFFGSKNRQLLNEILDDSDLNFTRWAIREVVNWSNQTVISPVLRIDAEKDRIFSRKGENAHEIKRAGHFIIVDNGRDISKIVNNHLENMKKIEK